MMDAHFVRIRVEEKSASQEMARLLHIRPGKVYAIAMLPNGNSVVARNRYLSLKYLSRQSRIDQSRFVVQLPGAPS